MADPTSNMDRHSIARVLDEIAFLLELKGENPFKAKAYANAARIVEKLPEEPAVLVQRDSLGENKGIGRALAATIAELVTTGSCGLHVELTKLFSPGLMELAGVPGLGPKKLRVIYEQLGVSSLGELQYACVENRLVDLPGFGKKMQEKILAGIRQFQRHQGFHLYADAIEDAQLLWEAVRAIPGLQRCDLAGSIRRRVEIVDRISFLAAGADARKVWETLFSISAVAQRTDLRHPALIAGVSPHGLPFEIKLVEMENYGWELVEATGNTEHVTALRQRLDNSRRFETEAAVYEAAGLPYIAPELREGHGEIELAASGRLQNLVKPEDVQGIFHNHTTYSDGAATVEQMVTVAHTLGYSYIGISDHSQSAFYANGLKEDRIKAQHAEIDELQKRWSQIRIFKGIEADILVDGTMDYADEILARFDFVIASVHSRFNLSEEDQTLRICRALSNPYVTMLGHATGRLLLSRDGFRVDMRRVIDTAAANGKILEINASPHRLELDWRFCRYAKQRGAKFSINPDAHSTEGLATVPLGVNVARKGALSADDIVNTLPVSKMETLLQSLRP